MIKTDTLLRITVICKAMMIVVYYCIFIYNIQQIKISIYSDINLHVNIRIQTIADLNKLRFAHISMQLYESI